MMLVASDVPLELSRRRLDLRLERPHPTAGRAGLLRPRRARVCEGRVALGAERVPGPAASRLEPTVSVGSEDANARRRTSPLDLKSDRVVLRPGEGPRAWRGTPGSAGVSLLGRARRRRGELVSALFKAATAKLRRRDVELWRPSLRHGRLKWKPESAVSLVYLFIYPRAWLQATSELFQLACAIEPVSIQ